MAQATELQLSDRSVYIVAAKRTPMGTFSGSLSSLKAPQLCSHAIKAALQSIELSADAIEETILGNVLQANTGQNAARQASIFSGIPDSVAATTVNKICASGMKAIAMAAQSISLGHNDIVLCGGMESMSNAPYYLPNARFGARMGHKECVDGMVKDGLWDAFTDQSMGSCAELCAAQHKVTRQQQDEFAINSFKRAQKATEEGLFKSEIVPVEVPQRRGPSVTVSIDEGISKLNEDKLKKLRGAFPLKDASLGEGGTVTAGNSSQISDGAAVVILMSGAKLKELSHIKPLVELVSYADGAQRPDLFPTSPNIAIRKALQRCKLSIDDLSDNDYYEINEAFAVAGVANAKLLGIPLERVNVFGGAVALGHPLGCSGARIIVTLINVLKHKKGRFGVAGVCNGGGGASAMIIKNMS